MARKWRCESSNCYIATPLLRTTHLERIATISDFSYLALSLFHANEKRKTEINGREIATAQVHVSIQ